MILRNNTNNILTITLYDILTQIKNIEHYKWKLLWIEGISQQLNMLELEETINSSTNGFMITSNELKRMSLLFDQLMELVLIGDKNEENLHKSDNDDQMKSRCDFFIELVDSSYWEIISNNEEFIKKLELMKS